MNAPDCLLIDDLEVQIIRSTRRKTLAIEVGCQGVKARAPARMNQQSIVDFVRSKRSWIKRHLRNLPEVKPKLLFGHGCEISFKGTPHRLSIIENSRQAIHLVSETIMVPVIKSHLPLSNTIEHKLTKWLKKMALEELQRKVFLFSKLMDTPNGKTLQVTVRDYKRRWGSCDAQGNLNFNWRIIQAPSYILDYVVVHELAHCQEFNHSKRFWSIVAHQMPDWKERQSWLNQRGAELYRF